ncbi:sirohydrochlorin cobaltochelatase [uncultured Mailhella sp.]|uniref:sirohydrochlorin cobaltochelatase n=1 Tax=uncultured Mailhella sp. TaxID=1981031 RepID=UPI002629B7CD|nr:sirohydrochlorin cobaltochelatase [uncultured Mailhella sp.]
MKRGVLLVAYGSESLRGTTALKLVQSLAEARFRLPVRWAFTSEAMRLRLALSRTKSDSVLKALHRMRFERYTHVAVQSLHLIPGEEYSAVAEDCRAAMSGSRFQVSLGSPILSSGPAMETAARALIRHISPLRAPDEPVVCMAHGSRQDYCAPLYAEWTDAVRRLDSMVHIACMIGEATLENLLPILKAQAPASRRVWLLPLLSLVGRHTLEDMAGASDTSWKSRIEAAGLCCQAELRGLADDPAFINLWLDKLASALAAFDAPLEERRPSLSPQP